MTESAEKQRISQHFTIMLDAIQAVQNTCAVVFIIGPSSGGKKIIFDTLVGDADKVQRYRMIGDVMYVELIDGLEVKQIFKHNHKQYSYKFIQFLFVTKYASFDNIQDNVKITVNEMISSQPKDGLVSHSSLIVTDMPSNLSISGSVSEDIVRTFSYTSKDEGCYNEYLQHAIDRGNYLFLPSGTSPTNDSITNLVGKVGFFINEPTSTEEIDANVSNSIIGQAADDTASPSAAAESVKEQLESPGFDKIVLIVGPMKGKCMDFLNYIRGPSQCPLGSSYQDNIHKVFYVVADVRKELSLFKIETLIQKIQIVFIYEVFYHDKFEQCMNDFKAFLDTLSPLNRVLLTQFISIVNMDPPTRAFTRYKFSIDLFNLQYEEGQRYYSLYKPSTKTNTQGSTSAAIPTQADVISNLSKDECFVQLINPTEDLDFKTLTDQV